MPSLDGDPGYQQQIKKSYGQKVFPFKIQQLINSQTGEGPSEPHDEKDEEKCFSHEPDG
jgi:hypothetical protein